MQDQNIATLATSDQVEAAPVQVAQEPVRYRNDGSVAFDNAHKVRQYDSFLAEGEAGDDHYKEHGLRLFHFLNTDAAKNRTEVLATVRAPEWKEFVDLIPEERRHSYNCNCCSAWFARNAGAVIVNEEGQLRSLYWDPEAAPEVLKAAYAFVKEKVEASVVDDFYRLNEFSFGNPRSGKVIKPNGEVVEFAHYHIAEVKELPVEADYHAMSRLAEIAQGLPTSDSLQTNGADFRKAILEVEAKDEVVLGGIAMLEGYLAIGKAIAAGRRHEVTYETSWNRAYFQLARRPSVNYFRGSAIGKQFLLFVGGQNNMLDSLSLYLSSIDKTKYKKTIKEASDNRLRVVEKFFTENGYSDSLPLRYLTREELVRLNKGVERHLWTSPAFEKGQAEAAVEKAEANKPRTSLLGHLSKSVRDEAAAEKVEKPSFPDEPMSMAAFVRKVIPKALAMWVHNPAGDTVRGDAMAMSYRVMSSQRQHLAVLLRAHLGSPEGAKAIWDHDAKLEAEGKRYPVLNYTIDARVTKYIAEMRNFWTGLDKALFEVSDVVVGGHDKDGDIAALQFLVPGITQTHTAAGVNPSYYPAVLRKELQESRDVMEQYIRDRGIDEEVNLDDKCCSLTIEEQAPIRVRVEQEDGFHTYVITSAL